MVLGLIVMGAVALALLAIGYLLFYKKNIALLHDYHHSRVREKDKDAFCTLCGLGLLAMGLSLVATTVWFAIAQSALAFLPFGLGCIIGIFVLVFAGRKYNR